MKLTREELYRAVWEKPAVHLAREYGISTAALDKLCRRLHIPKPVKGHWVKVMLGQRVPRPGLPALKGAESVGITPAPPRPSPHALTNFRREASDDVLPAAKEEPSPAVEHLMRQRDQLRASAADGNFEEDLQGLRVTPGLTDRALLFLDAVLKTLHGFDCHALPLKDKLQDHEGLILRRGETDVEVWLVEETVSTKKLISPIPAWARTAQQQQWFYGKTWSHTGRLEFRIHEYYLKHERRTWRDTTKKRLEEQLEKVVAGVLHTLELRAIQAVEQKREQDRWKAVQEACLAAERRREEEKARAQALEDDTERWSKCQQMRTYLAAYEARMKETGRGNDEKPVRWLAWAKAYVESQDPLA